MSARCTPMHWCAGMSRLDCYTVPAYWPWDCQWDMTSALIGLVGLKLVWGMPHLQSIGGKMQCIVGLCDDGFFQFFNGHWLQQSLTQLQEHAILPAVNAVQRDCETVYALCKLLASFWQSLTKTVVLPTLRLYGLNPKMTAIFHQMNLIQSHEKGNTFYDTVCIKWILS